MNAALPALRANTVVARLEAATALLAEADLGLAQELIAVGKAAEEYARSKKLGEEIERRAHAVTLKAERKLGELLAATPKNEGGRPGKTGSQSEPVSAPTLADLGVDKKQSMVAQQIAALPEAKFNEVLEGKTTVRKALSEARGEKPKPKTEKAAKDPRDAEIKRLKAALEDSEEKREAAVDTARDLEDKLSAYENTDPDEQQKEILKLQKRIVRLEAEIERLTRARNDEQAKNNELIREVKRLRKRG